MDDLVLPKSLLPKLITALLTRYQVFSPVDDDGVTMFRKIKDASELTVDFLNSSVPPKAIFFDQTETLFKFHLGRRPTVDPSDTDNGERIIFGIRPCDAGSLTVLDRVFEGDYEDPYYLSKRKNTILLGLSCTRPGVNCFCTSLDGSPASGKNMDVLLTDCGEEYYAEIISENGRQLIASANGLFAPATERDVKDKEKVVRSAIASITRTVNVDGIEKKLDRIFDSDFWRSAALKCLGCGICTYLCPTCHCFDIQDETAITEGARVRVWDSCMYPEYTLQSSGYNPRPERMNRLRNRVYHKYNYFPQNHGKIACVGCGRCVDNCPVNVDIISIITGAGLLKHE